MCCWVLGCGLWEGAVSQCIGMIKVHCVTSIAKLVVVLLTSTIAGH